MNPKMQAAMDRLLLLQLLKQNVIESASLTHEVRVSTEKLIAYTRSALIEEAFDVIAKTILDNNNFSMVTESVVRIYQFDRDLFTKILDRVFGKLADDESFKEIMRSLGMFQELGPIVDAYCVLFKRIHSVREHLWEFECTVSRLLQNQDLGPNEHAKLTKLLEEIRDFTATEVQHLAIMAQFSDLW